MWGIVSVSLILLVGTHALRAQRTRSSISSTAGKRLLEVLKCVGPWYHFGPIRTLVKILLRTPSVSYHKHIFQKQCLHP